MECLYKLMRKPADKPDCIGQQYGVTALRSNLTNRCVKRGKQHILRIDFFLFLLTAVFHKRI